MVKISSNYTQQILVYNSLVRKKITYILKYCCVSYIKGFFQILSCTYVPFENPKIEFFFHSDSRYLHVKTCVKNCISTQIQKKVMNSPNISVLYVHPYFTQLKNSVINMTKLNSIMAVLYLYLLCHSERQCIFWKYIYV